MMGHPTPQVRVRTPRRAAPLFGETLAMESSHFPPFHLGERRSFFERENHGTEEKGD
jgi:hypothetical protein